MQSPFGGTVGVLLALTLANKTLLFYYNNNNNNDNNWQASVTVDNRNCLFQAVMTHGTMAVRMQPCPCKRCPSNVCRGPASDVS